MIKLNIKDMALIAMLSATVTAGKLALSFIPNVEIVTLLFMVYTVTLGVKKSLIIAFLFSTTEILIYGFATWLLGYYLIWPVLIIFTGILKTRFDSEYVYASLSGLFGLFFGFFFALVESIFYGFTYGIAYWIRGIPFDIVHGVSNFIITLLIFKLLSERMKEVIKEKQ